MDRMINWNFDEEYHNTETQKYISAIELLEFVAERGAATPKSISESRRRENVVRLQCQRLVKYGLLRKIAHESYEVTEWGKTLLSEGKLADEISEAKIPQHLPNERITDFNGLDPEVIKRVNQEEFFEDPHNDYGLVNNSPTKTKRRIQNIKKSRLNRVMREFPTNIPVAEQCAHWLRAIVGIHFFPDANHRTAMATLSFLLDVNNIQYPELPGDGVERAVLKSKLIRTLLVDVRFDNLWEKDELFVHWNRYFQNHLYDVEYEIDKTYSESELKEILDTARELKGTV